MERLTKYQALFGLIALLKENPVLFVGWHSLVAVVEFEAPLDGGMVTFGIVNGGLIGKLTDSDGQREVGVDVMRPDPQQVQLSIAVIPF